MKSSSFILVLFLAAAPVWAGPPYLTDDPEPVDLHHAEINLFSSLTAEDAGTSLQPLFEVNFGPIEDVQLHFNIPYSFFFPADGGSLNGWGDAEAGVKFRFIHTEEGSLQVGVFPAIEIPTGEAAKGLGNGQAWWRFPLWVQKSWGPWTTYGGGGYAVNSAPGALNFLFGGWLLQYAFSDKFSLAGEVFGQETDSQGPTGWVLANLGGSYQMDWLGCNLLFSAGHSFLGESRTIAFLGLSWVVDFSRSK